METAIVVFTRDLRLHDAADALEAWRAGRTGIPIVDAGLRQLMCCSWRYPGRHGHHGQRHPGRPRRPRWPKLTEHGILSRVTPIQEAAVRAAVTVAARHGITAQDPAVLADGANIVVHLRPAPVVAKVAASTPAVRRDDQDWLQRELDVSAFLAAGGAPVVPPSPELPATTHRDHHHGHVMSFWRYLPPADPECPLRPDEETIGSMLRDLHAALRRYPETLPTLAPLQDIPAFLARPQTRASDERKQALAAAYQRLTAELTAELNEVPAAPQPGEAPAAPQQVLHGDAGGGNLMATGQGWVWHDFEDTCSGPVAWDLAASTASRYQDGPRVLAAYRDPVDRGQLAVCERLRWLHLTVWYNLYAERLPDLRPCAAELLTLWPAP